MNEHILSQDEVDALLQGITGESDKPAAEHAEAGAVRNHDLASHDRIVRPRMPMLRSSTSGSRATSAPGCSN